MLHESAVPQEDQETESSRQQSSEPLTSSLSVPDSMRIELDRSDAAVDLGESSYTETPKKPLSESSGRIMSSSTSSTESSAAGDAPSIKSEEAQRAPSLETTPRDLSVSESLQSAEQRESESSLPLEVTKEAVMSSSSTGLSSSSGSMGPQHVVASAPSPPPPLKSLRMSHLHKKYHAELEYMLKEFRKLESQLLGAKGNGTGVQESEGSRERREKLHSFILHLEDTIRQIEMGVALEAEGVSTGNSAFTDSDSLNIITKEKEHDESVQKLEEHILANLLPVKVRLKKQLAAQQGATRNPIGMPTARRGMLQPSAVTEKGTFAVAAEQRLMAAEAARLTMEQQESQFPIASPTAASQFGRPLSGGGSSLTQKLHGSVLGSKKRPHRYEVGNEDDEGPRQEESEETQHRRKVFYGGLAPGSEQVHSGVSAAAGVHKMIIETPALVKAQNMPVIQATRLSSSSTNTALPPYSRTSAMNSGIAAHAGVVRNASLDQHPTRRIDDSALSDEERKRLRKLRRSKKKRREANRREKERQKQILIQQQAAQAQIPKVVSKKGGKTGTVKVQGKKKGPRSVEYICALCSETYASTCDHNPWWALSSHECPKCRKTQVPRVDITSPANAIEYHPALLAHADETGSTEMGGSSPVHTSVVGVVRLNPGNVATTGVCHGNQLGNRKFQKYPPISMSDSEDSDFSDLSDGPLSDFSGDSDDSDDLPPLSPAEQAENENFGHGYCGPVMDDIDAKRLLVLMGHASTCPGRHKNAKHRDVCNSTKYLMLHIRDCPGTTATFDICPFPWCRKVKHLLYHLVSCQNPEECMICNKEGLSKNLYLLSSLNDYRRQKQNERIKAAMAAAKAKPKNLIRPGLQRKPIPMNISKEPTNKPLPCARPVTAQIPPLPLLSGPNPGPSPMATTTPSIFASAQRPTTINGVHPAGTALLNANMQSIPKPSIVVSSVTKVAATLPLVRAPDAVSSAVPTLGLSVNNAVCVDLQTKQRQADLIGNSAEVDLIATSVEVDLIATSAEVHLTRLSPVPNPTTSLENVVTVSLEDVVQVDKMTFIAPESTSASLIESSVCAPSTAFDEAKSSLDAHTVVACLEANFESAAATQPTEDLVELSVASAGITVAEMFHVSDLTSAFSSGTSPSLMEGTFTECVQFSSEQANSTQNSVSVNGEVMDATTVKTESSTAPSVDVVNVVSSFPKMRHEGSQTKAAALMLPHLPPIVADDEAAEASECSSTDVEVAEASQIMCISASGALDAQVNIEGSTGSTGIEQSDKKAQTVEIEC